VFKTNANTKFFSVTVDAPNVSHQPLHSTSF